MTADTLDVIVVGAGIAGLTAAEALSREGLTVAVCEARSRIGGRAFSLRTGAASLDLGATWFWQNESLTRAFGERLGADTFPQRLEGDALFEPDRQAIRRLDGNPLDGPSSRFLEGMQAIPTRLAARLPSDAVKLDFPVHSLMVDDDGVEVTGRGRSIRADQVVLAVPPALAIEQIRFLPALPTACRKAAEASSVWMGDMVKAVAVYDRAFWRSEGLSGSAFSYVGPFREFHDHSGPEGEPAALFAFAPASLFADAEPEMIEAAFRDQVARLFGTGSPVPREVHLLDWSRERFTFPGRKAPQASPTAFGDPVFRTPLHGRIHWASTETASAYAGHIEGAIRAGLAAARAAMG